MVGSPNISDVHFHKGEPFRFKAEYEVAPVIELGEYRGITVGYREPEVTDEDVEDRLNSLREHKAEYVNAVRCSWMAITRWSRSRAPGERSLR